MPRKVRVEHDLTKPDGAIADLLERGERLEAETELDEIVSATGAAAVLKRLTGDVAPRLRKVQTSFSLSHDTILRLEAMHRRTGKSRSWIVETLLDQLPREDDDSKVPKAVKGLGRSRKGYDSFGPLDD